jgi:phospholipase/carboxylesterase
VPEGLERYESALAPLVVSVLESLYSLEFTQRFLDPSRFAELRDRLRPCREQIRATAETLRSAQVPDPLEGFNARWIEGVSLVERALDRFLDPTDTANPIADVLASMRSMARAQETLYSIHEFPPLSRYFVEPALHDRLETLDPARGEGGASVGLHHSGGKEGAGARGQLCLYVPETYDGEQDWPLVVALHGGSGSGREFLWAWLREARGRRFLLMAPTASGPTWSLLGPDTDGPMLRGMVAWVASRWRVNPARVLLTGLSDGATYSLLTGLSAGAPFTHLAPISGVLHPHNASNGNLDRAKGKKIYLVHGSLDWMFPVQTARFADEQLRSAGAEVRYREIGDLSHTYPREENASILEWFDSDLALPQSAAKERG